MLNPGERKFHGSKTLSQSRHICITREQNNCQIFIYGTQYTKICIFGYLGGGGGLGGP